MLESSRKELLSLTFPSVMKSLLKGQNKTSCMIDFFSKAIPTRAGEKISAAILLPMTDSGNKKATLKVA